MLCNKPGGCYFHDKDTCQENACLYHGERGLATGGGETMLRGCYVAPCFSLPEGFELREDVHFVYLYKGRECVGVFNADRVTPEDILAECEKK